MTHGFEPPATERDLDELARDLAEQQRRESESDDLYYSERMALRDALKREDADTIDALRRLIVYRNRCRDLEAALTAIFEAASLPGDAALFNVVKHAEVAFLSGS